MTPPDAAIAFRKVTEGRLKKFVRNPA